ncbi:MAG: UDP-N-acetylmuramoyl-tripeptide--D-alanyl-D-alanine ligase [Eubacteriales bacterium]|nr:UDP-N-acetylmuramoyl-tripeptide--D-alanyl-D-alanine ligase [Eubacteriales bacterium]
MPNCSLNQILEWTEGQVRVPEGLFVPAQFANISTDTRAINQGDLFLALRGVKYDGHDFLNDAAASGAIGFVVDARFAADHVKEVGFSGILIVVPDTLIALQAIAHGYRKTLSAPVIGITGSVGKTTTRGLIAACLQPVLKICQTSANNNNEIGLPKTILTATAADQVVILEMGMRGLGEIELLSHIAQPDIAVITNIGFSHIERLGSQQGILQAKSEIIAGLKPGGLLVLNADDPHLLELAHILQSTTRIALVTLDATIPMTWPNVPIFCAESITIDQETSRFTLSVRSPSADVKSGKVIVHQPIPVTLPLPGRHLISNALYGLACAAELGVDLAVAAQGVGQFSPTGNRQRLIQAGSILVMDDSYNASPESMLAAMQTLKIAATGRRLIAALGGMLELGDYAERAHYLVGQGAAEAGFTHVLAIGPQADAIREGFNASICKDQVPVARKVETFTEQADLIHYLLSIISPADALLIKGSRGFAMEHVTAAILQRFAPDLKKENTTHA